MKFMMKLFVLMISILFMTVAFSCEMGVSQDESALVAELDALGSEIDSLEALVDSNYAEYKAQLEIVIATLVNLEADADDLAEYVDSLKNIVNKRLRKNSDDIDELKESLEALKDKYYVEFGWEKVDGYWQLVSFIIVD